MKYSHPPNTPVTAEFRKAVLDAFPAVTQSLLLPLLDHLLFGTFFDEKTGALLMGWELLNSFRGPAANKDFNAKKLVLAFSKNVFRIETGLHSWHGKQMACLTAAEIPEWLVAARDRMLLEGRVSDLIGFVSGEPVQDEILRSNLRTEAKGMAASAKSERILELLDYLNDLPSEHFDSIAARLPEATEAALLIESPVSRRQQIAMLHRIRACRQPFYKAVDTSTRIYSHGASYLNMSAPIRERLTGQWAKLDLKQAQLMIVSRLWGLEGIRAYLDRLDGSLWQDMAATAGVDLTAESKAAFKRCVYSLIYGMGRVGAQKNVADALGEDVARRCMAHPLIPGLLHARKAKMDDLSFAGRLTDAFGNEMVLADWQSGNTPQARARSIIACQAQSFEVPLLLPVIDYARETQGSLSPLYVVGWLHDGLWLHSSDPEALAAHLKTSVDLIQKASQDILGFPIGVDHDLPVGA